MMALLFFHEIFWKNRNNRKISKNLKLSFQFLQKFSWENNSAIIIFPHKNVDAKIFMNFDNKIKNDFWARDRIYDL
jgi:hypothetical protein